MCVELCTGSYADDACNADLLRAESSVFTVYPPNPPGDQMHISYLEDANLPGFFIIAVFAGLQLSLKVAYSVAEKLFVQLVVVSFLTCDEELFLVPCHLVKFIIVLESVMSEGLFIVTHCMLPNSPRNTIGC